MLPNRETDWFGPNQPVGRGAWGIGLFEANRLRQHSPMVGFDMGRQCEQIMARICRIITIGIKPYCFVRTVKKRF